MKCIHAKASALTRRSAGLPSMVTGLLAAHPRGPFFDEVISELQLTARLVPVENEGVGVRHLPQVHALNCLKEVFISNGLEAGANAHLAETISIAVDCLEHDL